MSKAEGVSAKGEIGIRIEGIRIEGLGIEGLRGKAVMSGEQMKLRFCPVSDKGFC